MDPDANYAEQLRIARRINESRRDAIDTDDVQRLAELVLALEEWFAKGGFLPYRFASHSPR